MTVCVVNFNMCLQSATCHIFLKTVVNITNWKKLFSDLMSNDWFYCFSSLTFKFIANSLIVLLAPTRYLSISIHLSFYYSIYLAFLSLVVRKNELEQQMLMNLNKKSWSDGLTLRDYKDHCGLNQVRTICTIYIKKLKNWSRSSSNPTDRRNLDPGPSPIQCPNSEPGPNLRMLAYYFFYLNFSSCFEEVKMCLGL